MQGACDSVSGVVLAGGRSRRLGRDKALLKLGDLTLIELVIRTLHTLTDDIVLAGRDLSRFADLDVQRVEDVYPGAGVLGGLYTGLQAVKHRRAIVVGCDMPFLNLDLLRFMLSLAPGFNVVAPRLDVGVEPLHAVYARSCLEPIKASLDEGRFRMVGFWDQIRVRYVSEDEIDALDPERLSFFNINTSEDLREARRIMALRSGERT